MAVTTGVNYLPLHEAVFSDAEHKDRMMLPKPNKDFKKIIYVDFLVY